MLSIMQVWDRMANMQPNHICLANTQGLSLATLKVLE